MPTVLRGHAGQDEDIRLTQKLMDTKAGLLPVQDDVVREAELFDLRFDALPILALTNQLTAKS